MNVIKPLPGGCKRQKARRRRAYSLMELTVSLGAASLLMAGVGSTIYVASRATRPSPSEVSQVVEGSMTADQLMAELQYAIAFNERSATAVEFTVADRTGDAAPEIVRYEWSGAGGDPITRQYNGAAPQSVVEDVHQFTLSYRVQSVSETTTQSGGSSPSAETLLAFFDGWSGITPSNLDFSLLPNSWMSEYFEVAWPEGAGDLNITRVRLQLWQASTAGQFTVGVYPANGGTGPLPSGTALGSEVTVPCSTLPASPQWVDIDFSDVTLSDQNSGYNIVVKGLTDGGRVRYLMSSSAPVDTTVAKWTTNGGASWSPSSFVEKRYDVPFYIYGTYTTSAPEEVTVDRHFVRSVGISLQVGNDATSRLDTATEILNAPEVASP